MKNAVNDNSEKSSFAHFATNAIHVGQEPEQWNSGAVVPPISLATTFKQNFPGETMGGFEYGRSGNPTRNSLEKCLASLENAKYAISYASGLATTDNILHLLSSGDHVCSMDDVYGGTNRYYNKVMCRMGINVTFVDMTNSENVRKAMKPNTRLVWIETPTNPLLKIVDIAKTCEIARQQPNCITVVDNTFASPYFQRPLDLGADIVMHSITKYINGHTDVIMGCLATNNDSLHERLRFQQNAVGSIPSPFDCYLVNRGIKTLHLRMEAHHRNGLAVARFLEQNPRVTKVLHPGLESHPQHAVAKAQMRGYSGMLTFYIKGGLEESRVFLSKIKVFMLGESLGGYESLAEHPALMTHLSVPKEQREQLGISDSLIRLSIGVEDVQDLIDDLDGALKAAVPNI